jgi:hypothetical protein
VSGGLALFQVAGESPRRLVRRCPQLPPEDAFQLAILAERGVLLPGGSVEAHQIAMRFFTERIGADAALGVLEGAGDLTGVLQVGE